MIYYLLFYYFFMFLFNFFLFLVFIVFLFVSVGLITVMESKILAFLGCSEGPCMTFKGLLVFFVDFFKLIFKSNDKSYFFYFSFLCVVLFIFLFYLLPFSSFGKNLYFGFIYFIMFDGFMFLFKILVFSKSSSKLVSVCCVSVSISHFVSEFNMFLLKVPIFFVIFNFNLECWEEIFCFFTFWDFLFFSPLVFLYFLVLFFEVSSTPFDYFEAESELVGGCTTDLGGGLFLLWSFMEYGDIFIKSCYFIFLFFPFLGNGFLSFLLMSFVCFFVMIFSGLLPSFDFYTSDKLFFFKVFIICNVFLVYFLIVEFLIYIIF